MLAWADKILIWRKIFTWISTSIYKVRGSAPCLRCYSFNLQKNIHSESLFVSCLLRHTPHSAGAAAVAAAATPGLVRHDVAGKKFISRSNPLIFVTFYFTYLNSAGETFVNGCPRREWKLIGKAWWIFLDQWDGWALCKLSFDSKLFFVSGIFPLPVFLISSIFSGVSEILALPICLSNSIFSSIMFTISTNSCQGLNRIKVLQRMLRQVSCFHPWEYRCHHTQRWRVDFFFCRWTFQLTKWPKSRQTINSVKQ